MATKKLKNSFTICILLVNILICCKNKSKAERSLVNSTRITTDTIFKEKGYFFRNKILYVKELKYSGNNPKITTYYIDKNHQKVLEYDDNTVLIKDTIYDINNDGLKDFILLYQTTGPVEHHVYLMNKNGVVANEIATYNYFPVQHKEFIQAVNFRSPIMELIKMRWEGTSIDTIEKIYYNTENPVYYKSKKYPYKEWHNHAEYIYDPSVKAEILKKTT